MRAASLNYRDLLFLSGTFGEPGPQGLIPCSDGAGEVIEVAPDVSRFKVGDRVAPIFNPEWIGGPYHPSMGGLGRGSMRLQGVMCEQIALHHSEVVALPAHLGFEEGAAFPCAGVTAWNALCEATPLLPGMSVLAQSGGGVSLFALQFARLFGARVIVTSSSPERCARLIALGADEVIDYRTDRSPMFSPATFEGVFYPCYQWMCAQYRQAGTKHILLHCDGNIENILDMLIEAGIQAIHPVEPKAGMDVVRLRQKYGRRLAFLRGLDNAHILPSAPLAELEAHVRRVLSVGAEGGLVIGGHSVGPDISVERYDFIQELIREYGLT